MAVASGLDWVAIDAEHGSFDWSAIERHIRAAVRSTTVLIVRVSELNISLFKRALDIGADGVAVPFINTAEDMRAAVDYSLYPPRGNRAVGGDRATVWGQCLATHVVEANHNILILPNLETVVAARNLDQILEVPGVDNYFFGPADFSASAGYAGQWQGPGVAEALLAMKDRIRSAGKHCGVIASSAEDIGLRIRQGFRIIGIGVDTGFLIRNLRQTLQSIGRTVELTTSLDPTEMLNRSNRDDS
jgi:2-dehydro-3-deoxyglucarate aldolase/4-hydroxy-2-oxoheptanedioate aldolase